MCHYSIGETILQFRATCYIFADTWDTCNIVAVKPSQAACAGKPQNCLWSFLMRTFPNSKVHGANMGPIWGRQDAGGPRVGPMNFATWELWCRTLSIQRNSNKCQTNLSSISTANIHVCHHDCRWSVIQSVFSFPPWLKK